MNDLYLLQAIFTDGCTYTNYVCCGVFRSKELAEASKKDWVRLHRETPQDWDISEIQVDQVV